MNKLKIGVLFVISMIAISGIAMAYSASVQDTNTRYYVKSTNGVLKAMFGTNHNFDNGFSTELTPNQVDLLGSLGVKTEPVQIYHIVGKPIDYSAETTPWGVARVNGGDGGGGINVAILDTGIDQDHPDLIDNIKYCVSFVTRFYQDAKSCEDKNGHGTHVAGTVAANGNIIGVAPEANLIIIKVCDRFGRCYGDDMAAGINDAVNNEANIISMSVGGNTPDTGVLEAIQNAVNSDVLVIAAAGNDGHIDGFGSVDYPAADSNVVAVGAIDSSDKLAYFSSLGYESCTSGNEEGCVELVAPGVSIESTWKNGGYKTIHGTSMATPHVAGVAALMWTGDSGTTRTTLKDNAIDLSLLFPQQGYGLIHNA